MKHLAFFSLVSILVAPATFAASFLVIKNKEAQPIRSFSGGNIIADVIETPVANFNTPKKHLGNIKYEDILLTLPLSSFSILADIMNDSLQARAALINGSIDSYDFNFKAEAGIEFRDATWTKLNLPVLDATSPGQFFIDMTLKPSSTKMVINPAGRAPTTRQPANPPTSNFRFQLDGVDFPRVSKISALTLTQAVSATNDGGRRDQEVTPGKIKIANFKIEVSGNDIKYFRKWHEDFVIKGDNDDTKEKNASIEILDNSQRTVLLDINFYHVGIVAVRDLPPIGDGANQIKKLEVELYAETVEFKTK